jgi:hypothetical protein
MRGAARAPGPVAVVAAVVVEASLEGPAAGSGRRPVALWQQPVHVARLVHPGRTAPGSCGPALRIPVSGQRADLVAGPMRRHACRRPGQLPPAAHLVELDHVGVVHLLHDGDLPGHLLQGVALVGSKGRPAGPAARRGGAARRRCCRRCCCACCCARGQRVPCGVERRGGGGAPPQCAAGLLQRLEQVAAVDHLRRRRARQRRPAWRGGSAGAQPTALAQAVAAGAWQRRGPGARLPARGCSPSPAGGGLAQPAGGGTSCASPARLSRRARPP